MKNIYLFNPETEMALASDSPFYMAPWRIVQMKEDLEMLPLWYAGGGDIMVSNITKNREWVQEQIELFNLKPVDLIDFNQQIDKKFNLKPWGWNRRMLSEMNSHGFFPENQPSEKEMQEYRVLSSRRYAAEVWDMKHYADLEGTTGDRRVITDSEECMELLKSRVPVVFKAVWSGSGRGLRWADRTDDSTANWCRRMLKNQGALIAESICEKLIDFAMEFEVNEKSRFLGYSLFKTNRYGAYLGNLLASQEEIEDFLTRYVGKDLLEKVKKRSLELTEHLYLGKFRGVLGIDMMICRGKTGSFLLHPLVEVNLRMNMGILSIELCRQLLAEGSAGYYLLENFSSPSLLAEDERRLQRDFPLVMEGHRIVKGYHAISPISDSSLYRSSVKVFDRYNLDQLYREL